MRHELFLVRLFMFVVLVTQSRVAVGLLALAKGATPDSGGRERPISRSRLKRELVLPPCPLLLLLSSHNVCLESLGPGSNHDPGALGDSQFLD